jgi:hypothetical protein
MPEWEIPVRPDTPWHRSLRYLLYTGFFLGYILMACCHFTGRLVFMNTFQVLLAAFFPFVGVMFVDSIVRPSPRVHSTREIVGMILLIPLLVFAMPFVAIGLLGWQIAKAIKKSGL